MFPPEVIDHVLSFLQWDHKTLKVCSRAHPSLSKLVERHLYRHLTVQNYRDSHSGAYYYHDDFLKRIVDNPDITSYVRSLRINVTLLRDYQVLELILPMLTQLRAIFLSSYTSSNTFWNLHESFRIAFTNCLQLPTLTHVKLSKINHFPLSALDHSSSLERLSLSGNFFDLPPSSPRVYPPLDFLDIRNCSSTSMKIITSWVESRSFPVRSLHLGDGLEQSSRLLGVCANTLTTLDLAVPTRYYSTPAMPLSLSYLPRLAWLTVQTPIYITRNDQFSCLPATMYCLNTLPSPPINLVHLIIKIDIWINNESNPVSDTDWSSLNSFPYFDAIRRVELQVQAHTPETYIPSVELLKTLKQDPQLMQLEMHPSFVINAVEKPLDSSWFDFGSD